MAEKEIEKKKAFNDLILEIESKGLRVQQGSPRLSLAFLVDYLTQIDESIFRLKEEIKKINDQVDLSWFLCKRVNQAYLDFLKQRSEKSLDKELKRRLDLIRQITENKFSFQEKAYKKGEKVSFGGVSISYAPPWYYSL